MSVLPLEIRKIILHEIDSWVRNNLMTEAQAYAIRLQYDFDFEQPEAAPAAPAEPVSPPATPAPQPAAPQAPVPTPTLMQTLLSEASIKVALYLGAFFVIAAALILAALVQSLRLPILATVAIGFFSGALVLRKRLPQPSFTLWLVFSALLPINAGVLADLLHLVDKALTGYWIVVLVAMTLLWAFSTWLYRSRFFSVSAFAALSVAVGLVGSLFDKPPLELYFLLLTIPAFCALAGVWLLKRWQGQDFALPLFMLAQLLELLVLCGSFLFSLYSLTGSLSGLWWPLTVLLWVLAAVFFMISDLVIPFTIFPFLTAGSLLLLPWFVMAQFHLQDSAHAIGWWGWGALFALAGEAVNLAKNARVRQYAVPFTLGAQGLLAAGSILGWSSGIMLGFMLFLSSAILLGVIHILKPRAWVWSAALLSGLAAYFLAFHLPGLEAAANYVAYQTAGAAALLLLPDLCLTPDLNAGKAWRWPLRVYGGLFLGLGSLITLVVGFDQPLQALLVFSVFAALLLAYALLYNKAEIGYLVATCLAIVVIFAIRLSGSAHWLWPLVSLAMLYYLSGWLIKRKVENWGQVLEFSGLALGALVAFSAPFENSGLVASLPVALVATLWAVEAFRRRNTMLGFPANGLYLMAYYMILYTLKVDQPQYYSIGAALLGMVMHYLLVRSGSTDGAFITGAASQLVLLGTTYIQMAGTQELSFFVVLFFQSLVVMIYGLVIRSRSLTFAPIGFVILGVSTVVFSMLKGISTVILIGCTGMIMIVLGVLAVAARERLTKIGSFMSGWIA